MAILVARTNLPVWDFQKLASLIHTCTYMHACMHVCTCMYMYVCTCMYVYVRAYMHVTYVWMHVCSVDAYVSMFACMHACMHAHTYACMHAWLKGLSCIHSRCVDKVVVHTNTVNQQSLGHFIILLGSAQAVWVWYIVIG